jgi:hypothetical protein
MDRKHELWLRRNIIDVRPFMLPVQKTYEQVQAEQKRKQELFASDYATEKAASKLVSKLLDEKGWSYEREVKTVSGKAIDFVVTAQHEDREIKFGIEVKRQMSPHYPNGLAATTLADHLEQAAAYARDLNMPVFIGPVQSDKSPSSMYTGGKMVDSVCALNIFGGRMNVGTFIVGNTWHGDKFFMILRGASFYENKFNPKRLNMVTSTGSKKERTDI